MFSNFVFKPHFWVKANTKIWKKNVIPYSATTKDMKGSEVRGGLDRVLDM